MSVKILKNALICENDNKLKLADVYFSDRIIEIRADQRKLISWKDVASKKAHRSFQQSLKKNDQPDESHFFNAKGLLLIPGAIDAHVHFNTPGFEVREDFEHGSRAAACGGVTTVIDMPCTSIPPVTNADNLHTKLNHLKNRSVVDFALWGGVSGNMFRENQTPNQDISEMAEAGVVGFKAYLVSGMDEFSALNSQQMRTAAELIYETGLPMAVHAEDHDLVTGRQSKFEKENRTDWQAYCESRDVQSELIAVEQVRDIARQTGCRMHIVHLSSQRGLQIVHEAKAEGLQLTAETCPHYLHFTQNDFTRKEIAAFLKTAPPVKHEEDRQELWTGLADGTLSFVTTDHAGCDPDTEKSSDNFWQVYGGIPGVEHRVPFMFSEGFLTGKLSLQKIIELLTTNVAEYFGLDAKKGSLKAGKDADFVLMDLWQEQKITGKNMHSKGKYTPFEGVNFNAVVNQTWLRGRLIAENGESINVDYNYGQWIKPKIS
jgi:allantoinase